MAGVVYICGWWGIPAVGTTVYNSVSGLTFVYCMFRVEVAYESLVTSLSPRGESQSLCVFLLFQNISCNVFAKTARLFVGCSTKGHDHSFGGRAFRI